MKVINFAGGSREEELNHVLSSLEAAKSELASLIEKYDEAGVNARMLDQLTEALDCMEDAAEIMQDAVQEN